MKIITNVKIHDIIGLKFTCLLHMLDSQLNFKLTSFVYAKFGLILFIVFFFKDGLHWNGI